eukprot:12140635-Alexandrium_andersonii.AAC.1
MKEITVRKAIVRFTPQADHAVVRPHGVPLGGPRGLPPPGPGGVQVEASAPNCFQTHVCALALSGPRAPPTIGAWLK